MIVGRERELAALETFVGSAETGAAMLLIAGEPGIGKTLLWEHGSARRAPPAISS